MTDVSWIRQPQPGKNVDLTWLNKDTSPVRTMFAPPKPPPPPPVEASLPKPPPSPPPPPPGPSPEERLLIAQCQQTLQVVEAALSELQEASRIEVSRTAELIVEMGLAVAEELAAGAIEVDENRVVATVAQALALLNSQREVKVYLNPAMYERLTASGALESLRKENHLTVRPEARVGDGGCIVESEAGQVDARIKSRLRQLRHLLAETQGTREPS